MISLMSEKKNWGSTVLGWFIVQEPQQGGVPDDSPQSYESADDAIIAAAAGAPSEEPAPDFFKGAPPPAAPGGKVDFEAVFEAAGVDADERERVKKALDLVRSLPPETEKMVKKQIVEASLKAFGVPIEKIIEAGVEEIQALEGYIRAGAADTQKVIEESDQRIRTLEQQIKDLRTVMQQRVEEQQSVMKACNLKKLEVQEILEFFGQEKVAQVVKDSPKLYEPQTSPNQ